jgi:hypothetical protein
MTLQMIRDVMSGTIAEMKPATALIPSDASRHGRLPMRSLKYPQNNPPINIPIKTAELNNSECGSK